MVKDFGLKIDFSEEPRTQLDAIAKADSNFQIDLETIKVTLNLEQAEVLANKLYSLIYAEPTWHELDNKNIELSNRVDALIEELDQYKEALANERAQKVV